ncbi:8-oxoguanine DNA glycosylase OGG fold protein [Aestuariibaculum lutulentum]|uniref:Uncharacterized protein n=1 Tax=Aestuariibaculum lutulentum TaxID=2920935 RepID=A0ABS9RGX8_9FLAO|nr:hypothetical protein [Aestuariibaculum lutulentum]MCH4552194.1 hypothetical protein [Aestuariibaculum lutulentum]
MIDLKPYRLKISNINTIQDSKFTYRTKTWSKLNPEVKHLIQDFENKDITREDVIKSYNQYYNNSRDYLRAFLLTMVWGFADTGYGTHRTNNYISSEANLKAIKEAIDAVKQNDLKKAFNTLKKIKGLGVSYITKILYFATRGANHIHYALIYDIRVASALVQLTSPKEVFDIVTISPSNKYPDYVKYNAMLHSLAEKYQLQAESIEMFLFEQKFD